MYFTLIYDLFPDNFCYVCYPTLNFKKLLQKFFFTPFPQLSGWDPYGRVIAVRRDIHWIRGKEKNSWALRPSGEGQWQFG